MQSSPKESKGSVADELIGPDKSLMQRFLRASQHYSPEEVELMTGVNRESVRLYRAGEWKRLTAAQRRKITAWLDGLAPEQWGDAPSFKEGIIHAIAHVEVALSRIKHRLGLHEADVDSAIQTVRDAEHPGEGSEEEAG